jgi:hypothetical protein
VLPKVAAGDEDRSGAEAINMMPAKIYYCERDFQLN